MADSRANLHPIRAFAIAGILVIALMCSVSCGGTTSPAAVASSPHPHVLAGQGTAWQVVATADGDVSGLALDGHGHLYAAEFGNNRVVELETADEGADSGVDAIH
jgi:hypothetical protein